MDIHRGDVCRGLACGPDPAAEQAQRGRRQENAPAGAGCVAADSGGQRRGEACAGARLRGEEHRPQGHRDAELLRQGRQNHEDHRRGGSHSGRVFPGAAG